MPKTPRNNTIATQRSLEKNIKELRCLHEIVRISGAPEKTITFAIPYIPSKNRHT